MRATKRELVGQLSNIATDHGLTLIDLALGFVLANAAVSSALIGPRTPEQLDPLLDAADVTLSSDVLAAIDRVVVPGRTVNPADDG
jgi:aryl-alcohol dehydrogenase-like predicted oxidoreductase